MIRTKDVFLLVLLLYQQFLWAQSDKNWEIEVKDIDPNNYYGVTVANGMIGLVPEPEVKFDGDANAHVFKVKDVVLNGTYDIYGRGRVSNILKVFNFANVGFENPVNMGGDSQKYADLFSEQNTLAKSQKINMREGVFTSSVSYKALDVDFSLRALRHLPNTAMVSVTVTAKQDVPIVPSAFISAPEILRDVNQYYSQVYRPGHVKIPLMTSEAVSPTGKHKVVSSVAVLFEDEDFHPDFIHEEKHQFMHSLKFSKWLKEGEKMTFHIVGSICSTEQYADPYNEAERLTVYAYLQGAARLLEQHNQAWDKLWASDIEIKGNTKVQKDVRFMLYHLYSFVRERTAYSLSPMGLSGLGYNGHVFWDTELWMYPPLLMLHPELAKSLLEYRYQRLEAAKQNAASHGYQGAMFPWESDDLGQEATPIWALTGPFEHHITGDVGWAFWKYYQVTKDEEWLADRGYPVLKEVADFWASRVEKGKDGKYHILNVVGADEYAENVDDNAFTNGVAKIALSYAVQAAKVLGKTPNPRWKEVSENIVLLKFEDGVTQEYKGYEGQIIKQADVNLLAYPLDMITDKETIRKDLEYYQPKIDPRGPAMGYSVLSILHNRLGNVEKSEALFIKGYKPNEAPPFGVLAEFAGGTNPYFATGAGGALQAVLSGFGGLVITDEGIQQVSSQLPKDWELLTLKGVGINDETFKVK